MEFAFFAIQLNNCYPYVPISPSFVNRSVIAVRTLRAQCAWAKIQSPFHTVPSKPLPQGVCLLQGSPQENPKFHEDQSNGTSSSASAYVE